MSLKPLAGVRVLDFTAFPPGGYCTVLLADLGAEIVRVESPAQKGRPSLVIGQVGLSRGKRSMTLDMRNPAAVSVLQRLAPAFDAAVENAAPGAMESRGFGYAQARAANPRIVWCAMTGFGQEGPYAQHPGHDISYAAHSGLLSALNPDLPWHPAGHLAVPFGALMAVIGIQSALIERARSGLGGYLDISLSESAAWALSGNINPLSAAPLAIPASPDRRLYACGDGRFVAVASAEPRTWGKLCEALGAPELQDALGDRQRAAATTEALAAIFRTRPATEWMERLGPTGAAVAIVNHGDHLLADPQVQARGSVVESAGVPVPANPVRLSSTGGEHTTTVTDAPHTVGQDTEDVLASAGFSGDEIQRLQEAGVV
jgi:alpha-methylacyl-CoA racemase